MKISILGQSGTMGGRHLKTVLDHGCELVDPDSADIVIIAIPDCYHARYVIRHLAQGQAVFCEKPICTKMEELDQIRDLSRANRLGCHLPLREKAGEFTIQGDQLDLLYDYGRRDKFIGSWRNSETYNLVMGGGIHLMDIAIRKFGMDWSDCKTIARQTLNPQARCPDRFMGRFYLNGLRCCLKVDFTKNGPHRHVVAWNGGRWENHEELDKSIQLRRFLEKPVTDEIALAAHRACLEFT